MAYQFGETRLLVSDVKACFLFYRDVMKFDVHWGHEYKRYAAFETGGTKLALYARGAMADAVGTEGRPSHAQAQDRVALSFAVDDVDEEYQRLKDEGVAFITEPKDYTGWGIRAAHFRDPDGTLIEINKEL